MLTTEGLVFSTNCVKSGKPVTNKGAGVGLIGAEFACAEVDACAFALFDGLKKLAAANTEALIKMEEIKIDVCFSTGKDRIFFILSPLL